MIDICPTCWVPLGLNQTFNLLMSWFSSLDSNEPFYTFLSPLCYFFVLLFFMESWSRSSPPSVKPKHVFSSLRLFFRVSLGLLVSPTNLFYFSWAEAAETTWFLLPEQINSVLPLRARWEPVTHCTPTHLGNWNILFSSSPSRVPRRLNTIFPPGGDSLSFIRRD